MKTKTKKAAEAIRQGFLSFPSTDLLQLFEWLFERAVDNGYEGDWEIELREALGYKGEEDSLTGWADHSGEALIESLKSQDIRDFAHGAGSLPFYAGLLNASSLDCSKMLEEEHKFGNLLVAAASKSPSPFILVKIRFEALSR